MDDYTVILVKPSRAQNVGSICRLIQNFGSPQLIIVKNEADLESDEFRNTARHAKEYVSEIIHVNSLAEALKMNISYSIASTARQAVMSTTRISFTPKEIPDDFWKQIGSNPALVFGNESYGLNNIDIALCDYLVTIPTSNKYASINLSHAVGIMCHEFYVNYILTEQEEIYESAPFELKQQLEQSYALYAERFLRKERIHISREIFHNLIARSRITEGEASNLIGAFKAWEFHIRRLESKLK